MKARPSNRWIVALGIFVLAWTGASTPLQAQEQTDVRTALEKVLTRREYQRDLPDGAWPRSAERVPRSPPPRERDSGASGFEFPATGPFCFWGVIGLVLATLLVWLARSWRASSRDVNLTDVAAGGRSATDGTVSAGPRLPASPREAALRAAEEQRFDEALHILLLDGLVRISGPSAAALSDSTTSRERLAKTPAESVEREALGVLVTCVERTLFGGRPAGRPEFEQGLAGYDRLLESGGS